MGNLQIQKHLNKQLLAGLNSDGRISNARPCSSCDVHVSARCVHITCIAELLLAVEFEASSFLPDWKPSTQERASDCAPHFWAWRNVSRLSPNERDLSHDEGGEIDSWVFSDGSGLQRHRQTSKENLRALDIDFITKLRSTHTCSQS